MPTYTADQLAAHLRARGADVHVSHSADGASTALAATYGAATVISLFAGQMRTGQSALFKPSRFRWAATMGGGRGTAGQVRTIKAMVDHLGLPAAALAGQR